MIFGQGSRAPTLWSPPVALRRFTTRVRFLIINRSAVAETRANCFTNRLDGIEASVNELLRKTQRPGGFNTCSTTSDPSADDYLKPRPS